MSSYKQLEINLKSPSFSINSAYYKNRKRTTECRKWGKRIHNQLEVYRKEFDAFRAEFDPIKHAIQVTLDFNIPHGTLFTKRDGSISKFSKDLSNVEKLLIDLVFDTRYYDRGLPSLSIDDKFIVSLISRKKLSLNDEHQIKIVISRVNLNDLKR